MILARWREARRVQGDRIGAAFLAVSSLPHPATASAARGYNAASTVHSCQGQAMQAQGLLGTERNAPPHFAGRGDELRQLATYAEYVFGNADPSGGIVLIDGVPGAVSFGVVGTAGTKRKFGSARNRCFKASISFHVASKPCGAGGRSCAIARRSFGRL